MCPDIKFCVIIVNYKGSRDTIDCVRSLGLAASSFNSNVQILVVDNSNDKFGDMGPTVSVIKTGWNIGLSGAWFVGFFNEAAQACDYCIFINNDTIVENSFFHGIEKGIRKWGDNCAFGPRICYFDNPTRIWSRGGKINRYMVSVKHYGENLYAEDIIAEDFVTGHLSGCCLVIKTSHLNKIGGPDPNFFFRGEEWDLNFRLNRKGIKLVLLDQVNIYHKINGSHERFDPLMLYLAYRAKVLFAKKSLPVFYFPFWYISAVIYCATISAQRFARYSNTGRHQIRKMLVKALLDGLKSDKILPVA